MDILEQKIVAILKPQKCWGCAKEFPVGTKLEYLKTVDGGAFLRSYWCDTCQKILDLLDYWEIEDGFNFGELAEHYRLENGKIVEI